MAPVCDADLKSAVVTRHYGGFAYARRETFECWDTIRKYQSKFLKGSDNP